MSKNIENREPVIRLENVNKTFFIRDKASFSIRDRVFNVFNSGQKRAIHALQDINLEIRKGEFIGVLGRNGSGKSTLINVMSGAYPPNEGGITDIKGKHMRLSLGMGFNNELTARENIYINASLLGITFRKIGGIFNDIIEFAELEGFIDTKIKYYSRGMRLRLSFAIALHAQADIFLMDEFFGGVGDERFQEKTVKVFKKAFIEGKTIVLVSHSMETIKKYSDRAMLLNNGKCIAFGNPDMVIRTYRYLLKGKSQMT